MEKIQKNENKKDVKTKKSAKVKTLSGCGAIREVGLNNFVKDTKEHAEKALALLKNKGVTENKNKKPITVEGLQTQIGSINRHIIKKTQAHWSRFKIVEKKDVGYKYERV